MSDKLARLKALADKASAISTYEIERKKNFKRLKTVFDEMKIDKKISFDELFTFKAINLMAISLSEERLGEISHGKYAQIIAIRYVNEGEKKKAKNISLRYFGRVEKLDNVMKNLIIEFILRWRLEKSFRGLDHYRHLLSKLDS